MVAYSFKERFVGAIMAGLEWSPDLTLPTFDGPLTPKRQTIRALGRRRHARPGDQLQLYVGLRTKQCRLIGRARCVRTREILIGFRRERIHIGPAPDVPRTSIIESEGLLAFARKDGFRSWSEMKRFWAETHNEGRKRKTLPPSRFIGVLIEWEPIP